MTDDQADREWVQAAKVGPFIPVTSSPQSRGLENQARRNGEKPSSDEEYAAWAKQYLADVITGTVGARVLTLSDVEVQSIEWMWPGHLAIGKVHMLDGDPGKGKSMISQDWAARVSQGIPFPGQTESREPGNVIIMAAEDGMEDTVKPRCLAAGADVTKLHAFTGVPTGEVDRLGQPIFQLPKLPTDIRELESQIVKYQARLLIIDTIASYVERGVRVNDAQDIRLVLDALKEVAERTGCIILVLRHLNKSQGLSAMYRGSGSVGITGAARVVMMVGDNPDDSHVEDANQRRKVLAVVKTNLSAQPSSLDYLVVQKDGQPMIQWGNFNTHSADDLLGLGAETNNDAATWLREFLTDGGKYADEVEEAGKEEGYTTSQLRRAKRKAGVESVHAGEFGGRWYWRLKRE